MFFTFNQNNPGGSFIFNEKRGISHFIIIEADSAEKATEYAQDKLGVYFNGVEKNKDCNCCGDRWYPVYQKEGTILPELYGEEVMLGTYDIKNKFIKGPEIFIHFKTGKIKGIC